MLESLNRELFTIGDTPVTTASIVIFVVTILVAVVVSILLRRAIMRFVRSRAGSEGGAYAFARILQILVIIGGVLLAFDNIGIDITALAAAGAVLTVGIGLGLQGVAQNFISGIAILVERPVQKGDFVVIGDTVGEVQEISLRATRVLTRDSVLIVVPNVELFSNRVVNMSQPKHHYRARVKVGVAYGSDTAAVRDALLEVAKADPDVISMPPPAVFFRGFGNSSLDFELAVWLSHPRNEPAVLSNLRFAIDQAFRDRGITIPFPQRDLHLQSVAPRVLGVLPQGQ